MGKTALVHELAHRIADGSVPDALQKRPLWFVDGARLLAGSMFLGQWQEKALAIAEGEDGARRSALTRFLEVRLLLRRRRLLLLLHVQCVL